MIGFNGGLIGKPRSTSAQLSVPGVWTAREQLEAVRNNLWPGAAVVATGGTETTITDGGISYRVHTFLTSGALTVTSPGLVQYLVVGGGGGGGGVFEGGGGGAGGLLAGSVFLTGSQTITVGAFGTGGTGPFDAPVSSTNGGNSSIGTLVVAIGGGRGAHHNGITANSGGSGGGGAHGVLTGGAGTSGQGFAGGDGVTNNEGGGGASDLGAGGGGGAGTAGTTAIRGVAQPAGGLGLASSIQTGSAITYAVGGNGSRRGNNVVGAVGTTNRGNGGGGSSASNGIAIGANGGSGIVIIRYPN